MSLINQDIKNFVQGISQQPSTLREPEQLEEQINGFSSEASGLQKRPPTMLVSSLTRKLTKNTKPLVHFIDRDTNEKYIVLFTGEDIKVYDLKGNEQTVTFNEGTKPYIYTEKPRYTLKVVTIADYTFVCNRMQLTKMSDVVDDTSWETQGVLVNIKSGQYGRKYRIDINGETVATYETPDGSDKSHTKLIATDYIVEKLSVPLKEAGYSVIVGSSWLYIKKSAYKTVTGETKYLTPSTSPKQQADRFKGLAFNFYNYKTSVSQNGYVITVSFPNLSVPSFPPFIDATVIKPAYDKMIAEIDRCRGDRWDVTSSTNGYYDNYTLTWTESTEIPSGSKAYSLIDSAVVYDGYNNQAAFGIMNSTQKFANLPVSAPDGYTVKVTGEKGSNTDEYYVRYDAETQVWRECARPSLQNHIDEKTMPHVLVREADGTFNFRCAEWATREIGDDDSNPLPSFIDNTINDIFYYRNRLGLLSGENVILTRSADFFNFWMTSAMEVQDTDPIDLAVSDNKIATLYHAVPFDAELILFSKDAQFALRSDSVLTPKDAYLTPPVTHFECSLKATPVNAGRNIYFLSERSEFSTVREFFTAADNTDSKDAQDITSHVPSFVPNGVYKIVPSSAENILLFLTEGEEDSMYVYKYLFIDSIRQQASWSKWTFNGTIYGASFVEGFLYVIVERNDYLCLERMSFTFNTEDLSTEPYRVLLDSKLEYLVPSSCYDDIQGETTINLQSVYGDIYDPSLPYGIVTYDGVFKAADSDGNVVLQGDYSNKHIICGLIYLFRITLSTLYVKREADKGVQSLLEGRLQLRQLWLNYANSGCFVVKVNISDKDSYEYVNTERILGTSSSVLGSMVFPTGKFTVPIQSVNTNCSISVESDNPTPLSLIGAGWIGNYVRRTRLY